MAKQRYTASISRTKGRSALAITFRHPLRKDTRGKSGLKVRRGLSTNDQTKAEGIVNQMNELLATPSFHSISKRQEASLKFSPIVVSAFYDAIEEPVVDSFLQRDKELPLPGQDEGYSRVLLVGTTGAGKTSLMRHLIGSHPDHDRFPSTATARTTIADIEVITEPNAEKYHAAVTFFSESSTLNHISECIIDACVAIWQDASREEAAQKLLHHRDQRFRLSYILGPYSADDELNDDSDWTYEGNASEETDTDGIEEEISADVRVGLRDALDNYLDRLYNLAGQAHMRLDADFGVQTAKLKGEDFDAAHERFEELIQESSDFYDILNDIKDDILRRFEEYRVGNMTTSRNGWPMLWTFYEDDRTEFIRQIRWFSSNYYPAFGRLLTPLVDGIRIRGDFHPSFSSQPHRLVLMDGEGLGHTPDSASGVTTHITSRYADADVILLVDSAKQPMLAAPLSVLRSVASSGHQRKLAIAFTHFDHLKGSNMRSVRDKRAHVVSSLIAGLESLQDVLTNSVVSSLERHLKNNSFMLGWLDKSIRREPKGVIDEFGRLLTFFTKSIQPEQRPMTVPYYDSDSLFFAVQAATRNFNRLWEERLGFVGNLEGKEHWARIKALNRRIALSIEEGEYRHLKPVAELIARLSEAIAKFLNQPSGWKGQSDDAEREQAIAALQREIYADITGYVRDQILIRPLRRWIEAYELRGKGSTIERARSMKYIYEFAAPVPGDEITQDATQFLREVRKLVDDAIKRKRA